MAALVVAVSGCGVERDRLRACERLIAAFESDPGRVEVLRHERHGSARNSVVVHYRTTGDGADGADDGAEHWIACWFGDRPLGADRLVLEGVATDRRDLLTPVQLAMLRIWLRIADPGR